MLAADRKRAFGFWLWAAVLLMTAVYCGGSISILIEGQENAMVTFLFNDMVVPVGLMTPLAAALPFAAGFAIDWRSGMAVSIQLRSGRRRFLFSKLLCCLLSGGLALALSLLLFIGIVNLRLTHDYAVFADLIGEASFFNLSRGWSWISFAEYYGGMALVQFMSGLFWASAGLAFSAFQPNLSLVLCAPPVLYRLVQSIAEAFPEWQAPFLMQAGASGLTTVPMALRAALQFGVLALVCSGIFYWRASKRLQNT